MTIHPRSTRTDLFTGQAVHVNAHAAWLPATVVSVAHAAVGISLTGPKPAATIRTVAPCVVRPADGHRLEPVHRVRHGDEVAAADGSVHTIAGTPWRGRDGWWLLTYTNGEQVALPPGAVLRLTDPTPAVSINGAPLTQPTSPYR